MSPAQTKEEKEPSESYQPTDEKIAPHGLKHAEEAVNRNEEGKVVERMELLKKKQDQLNLDQIKKTCFSSHRQRAGRMKKSVTMALQMEKTGFDGGHHQLRYSLGILAHTYALNMVMELQMSIIR